MNKFIKYLFLFLSLSSTTSYAQYSLGNTGLLTIPTADMEADGRVRLGANYLPENLIGSQTWDYNTGNYFVNITFLPFLEVTYRCTLFFYDDGRATNQDRSIGLRLCPLKEGRYYPGVVVGSNDLLTTGHLNTFEEITANRHFSQVYGVLTKHLKYAGHDLGITVGANFVTRDTFAKNGLFFGASYRPSFIPQLQLMVDWNKNKISYGASALLWKHLNIYAFCHDIKTISGGLRYEFTLY